MSQKLRTTRLPVCQARLKTEESTIVLSHQIPINDSLATLFKRIKEEQDPKSNKFIGLEGKPLREKAKRKSPYVFTYMRYLHLSQEHKKKAVNLLTGLTASQNLTCHKSVTSSDFEKCNTM